MAANLIERGLPFDYEPCSLAYHRSVRQGKCSSCGSREVTKLASYTPDFRLRNGTFVESKGKFTSANRTQMVDFKAGHPDVTVRLLFMADNWLTKKHKHNYTGWAKSHGFDAAVGVAIPDNWSI